jgi:hypothetical protein
MNHEQALKLQAAERYLLHDLSPQEREDFEEHYFACAECGDEVRSAFALADNAKGVFAAEADRQAFRKSEIRNPKSEIPFFRRFRPAFAAPVAAALLLGVVLYQSVWVIPGLQRNLDSLNQAQVIPSIVARAAIRGEDTVVEISERDRFVQLMLDINMTVPDSSYTCDVYDEAGSLRFTVPAASPSRGSLHLLLPASELKSGRYIIRVRTKSEGGSVSEAHMNEYSFAVRSK